MVRIHLFKNGFMSYYYVWNDHGEEMSHFNNNHVGALTNDKVNHLWQ